MSSQNLIIYKFTSLYHILQELGSDLNFKITFADNLNSLNNKIRNLNNYLIISHTKNSNISNYFVLDKKNSFLHFPPWGHYLNYKFYQTFENLGNHIFPYMGGLMVCVCKKIVYAKTTSTSKKIPIKNVLTT